MNPLKQFLIGTAKEIKDSKRKYNDFQRAESAVLRKSFYNRVSAEQEVFDEALRLWIRKEKLSYYFRSHLIAYCELKGLPRDRIEKPAPNNPPNEQDILKIKDHYRGYFSP